MNRFYQSLAALMLLLATGGMSPLWGQLTGTINVPGAYPDLQAAIADLNLQGVGAGGVVINLLPGNPQTAPAGGYAITATGTVVNPIVIAGNSNMITASTGHTVGALNDAVFKIIGSDFITLTGFSMQEDPANTVTAAATNNMTEFGVALFYASAIDGCQDVSIVNNQISLNRTYQNTFGIYSNSTHTATAVTTAATATGALGGNHNLKIYGNQVSNVNIGIVVVGPTVAADHNQTIDIGGTAALTGNTISNFGTTGTFSNYANVSGSVNGILVRNSTAINISNNSITSSSGGTTAGTLRGIFIPSFSNAPVGTFSHTINNNTLSIQSGAAGGSVNGIIVEGTTGTSTSSLLINNNQFTQLNHSVAGTGAITAISNAFAYLNVEINSNAFVNLSTNTTGSFTFITNNVAHPAGGVQNVNNNAIQTGFSKTGAGGTVTLYFTNSTSGATVTQNNNSNNFSNITLTGATVFEGWRNTDGGSPIKNIQNNIISNIVGGTSAVTGMFVSFSGSSTVSNNQVFNITNGAAITGISTGAGIDNFTNNTIHSLTGTGTGTVTGLAITGGTTKVLTGNKIYNLENTNAGGAVFGISSTGSTTATLVNNLVGDLRAPNVSAANGVIGINITGGTTVNAFYNSVHMNAVSIGANFGSSAISASSTPNVTLRNNIFINKSTPNGTGFAVAYRRSSTTLTSYNAASNNNLFYAGTPGANNLIFFDGTNSDQLLADFQTRVATRDALSVTEDVSFLSLTGSSANFLRINPVTPSLAESGASNIGGITTDYDNAIRAGNAGYAGTGTAPDMGALEFEGSNPNSCSGTPAAANALSSAATVCPSANFTLSLSTSYSGAGFTYQWQSSPDGSVYTNITGANSATYVAAQTSATFYQCIITCVNSAQSITSTPVEVTMSSLFACYCAPTYTSGCGSGDAITNVTLADLNNTSGCAASPYYTFFNAVTVPALARTTQYTVNVSFGADGSQFAGVWIDYNQDGDFADAGEFVGNNTVSAGANGTASITFTIPAGATIGQTMMRIRGGNDSQLGNTPCGASSSGFGETEDYLVNIVDMPSDPPVPVQDPAAPTCTAGTDLSVPGTPNAGEAWFWQTSASGTSTANPVSGPYTVFQNGTYFVRTYNATFNLWSVNSTSVTVSNIPVAVAPPAPVAAASPACLTTTISVAAPVDPNLTYFWQGTVSNGVDNTQDALNPYTVTASGTYYVSSFDVSTGCWSDGVGVAVLIDTYIPDAPTAATPFDYCVGATTAVISANAPGSGSQSATTGTVSIAIPDNNPTGISNTLAISGIPSGAVVTSVAITMSATHTWNGDLDIRLTGPNGNTIDLSMGNGGSTDNYLNTVFTNTAVNPITSGTGPFTGTYLPEGNLTTLFSIPNGNWILLISDNAAGDVGTLTSWSVAVNYTLPAGTITWHNAASGPAQIGTGSALETIGTSVLPNGNTPGTYSFYAQSESGSCSSLTRTQVDVVINPFSATVTAVDVTCNGANNGTFTVTAPNCGTAPYEYAVDGGVYTSTIPSNLTPGAHTVMVRDDNGFETELYTITITQPAQLIASETHVDVLCNGAATGSIDVTITGGTAPYAFTWSNGAIGEDQTGIVAGTYNLVVTDTRGCNAFASVNITQPTAIVITETHNDLNCNGDASGSIDLSVSGGIAPYTYSWDNGATTEDVSTLAAGTYVVTVTDDNACTSTLSVTITEPVVLAAVVATATQPSACGATDGALDVAVTGGVAPYTFAWSNAETTEDISAIGAGLYTLTAADDNGCFVVLNTSLSDPNAPVAVVDQVNNVLCFGAATGSIDVTVSGGVSPYTYFWSGGSTSEDLSNATAGVYTLTVTADDGCQAFASGTITQNAEIVIASVATATLCNGDNNGAIDITVTGGVVATAYDYSWSNSAITEDITALSAGNYTVTITDDNLCTATSTITVTEPAVLAAVGVVTNVSCNGLGNGSINLTISGGTPAYDVLWSSGAVTEDVSGLAPASYTVTVTDDNACVATASFTITEPTVLGATATSTDEINGNDGSVNLTVTGGSTPYSFAWNNSATTEDLSGVVAGNYSVTVTDANGCTATVSITVGSQVSVNELGVRVINIYPNPSNGIFYIEMNGQPESGDRIFVRDALGRLVLEENIMQNRITLNLDTQERGFYLVEVWSAGQRSVHRIQLQR